MRIDGSKRHACYFGIVMGGVIHNNHLEIKRI
jgi:hypothetical protein